MLKYSEMLRLLQQMLSGHFTENKEDEAEPSDDGRFHFYLNFQIVTHIIQNAAM